MGPAVPAGGVAPTGDRGLTGGQHAAFSSEIFTNNIRVTFLVINRQAKPISKPTARVWVARKMDEAPLVTTTAQAPATSNNASP